MAAATVPSSEYSKLLVLPPATSSGPEPSTLPSMRFDEDFFERGYQMCRGAGHCHRYCARRLTLVEQRHRNTTQDLFEKELVDAVECMSALGDSNKCQHHLEGLHRTLHHQRPTPTTAESFVSFLRKFRGTSSSSSSGD
eukprot:GHVS01069236.1.p1 GENE.GHVS01069236.1~~GHVS01069236.1.p1  ORF type:complete len:139 (+),score=28.26 GHVS01069236.1:155-571(+)